MRATETRLLAELAGRDSLVLPPELAVAGAAVADIWQGQLEQVRSRHETLEGQRRVIGEKIKQLEAQIAGGEAQVAAYGEQIASVRGEAASVAPLVEKNLLPRPRLLQLERTASGLEAQIADAQANIAKATEAIGEQEQQSVQLGKDRMADVAKDLHEVQSRLLEVVPKRLNAAAVLGRTKIRAPYSGRVVGLNVFGVGGVVQRGEKILDIVPAPGSHDRGRGRRRGHQRAACRHAGRSPADGLQAAGRAADPRQGRPGLGRPSGRSQDQPGALHRLDPS